jgi:hypothetical protein
MGKVPVKTGTVCDIFNHPHMFNMNFGARAIGAVFRNGSVASIMMRLLSGSATMPLRLCPCLEQRPVQSRFDMLPVYIL